MLHPRMYLAVVPLALLAAACAPDASSLEDRQASVRAAGAAVMPFDLDKTKHSFTKTENGGVQAVVVLDATDTEQVRLVREHLEAISVDVASGRFVDPMTIHGIDMPGVQALAAGAEGLEIEYQEIPAGAQITYRTDEGSLVGHLHDWFEAQAEEHGPDAISEPYGHVMTEEMWRAHHPGQPYPGPNGHD